MTILVLVSLPALGAAVVAGLLSPLPAMVIIVLGVAFVVLHWAGGTTLSAGTDSVRVALFPL